MKKSSAYIFGIGIIILLTAGIFATIVLWPKEWRVSFLGWSIKESKMDAIDTEWVKVARVIDGDTIELENREKVRYVGVNTPESVDPRRKVECFGKESSAYNKNLVEGKWVRLEWDISDRDKYGRLLRSVYLEDGTFVNEILVREGYAHASPYTPDISKKELFREAEMDARMNARGLWSPDTCDGKK
ncbi:MAG: thermonuclease family protein [Candidatus Moraniibacteriota bacterium]